MIQVIFTFYLSALFLGVGTVFLIYVGGKSKNGKI